MSCETVATRSGPSARRSLCSPGTLTKAQRADQRAGLQLPVPRDGLPQALGSTCALQLDAARECEQGPGSLAQLHAPAETQGAGGHQPPTHGVSWDAAAPSYQTVKEESLLLSSSLGSWLAAAPPPSCSEASPLDPVFIQTADLLEVLQAVYRLVEAGQLQLVVSALEHSLRCSRFDVLSR